MENRALYNPYASLDAFCQNYNVIIKPLGYSLMIS